MLVYQRVVVPSFRQFYPIFFIFWFYAITIPWSRHIQNLPHYYSTWSHIISWFSHLPHNPMIIPYILHDYSMFFFAFLLTWLFHIMSWLIIPYILHDDSMIIPYMIICIYIYVLYIYVLYIIYVLYLYIYVLYIYVLYIYIYICTIYIYILYTTYILYIYIYYIYICICIYVYIYIWANYKPMIYPANFASRPGPPKPPAVTAVHIELDLLGISLYGGLLGSQGLKIGAVGEHLGQKWELKMGQIWDKHEIVMG